MIRMGEQEGGNWGESVNRRTGQRDWGVAGDPRRGERGDTGHLPPPAEALRTAEAPRAQRRAARGPPGLSEPPPAAIPPPPEQPLIEAEAALGVPGPPRRVGAARGTAGFAQGRLLVRAQGDDVTARASPRRRGNGRGQSR